MKITIVKSLILVIGGICLMTAMDLCLSNLLYAILYGISFEFIIGSYLNIALNGRKEKINTVLQIVGNAVLVLSNLIVLPVNIAIPLSVASSVFFCGTFVVLKIIIKEIRK